MAVEQIEPAHSGEAGRECPDCGKAYATRRVMYRHRRDVHGYGTGHQGEPPPPKAEKTDKAPRAEKAAPAPPGMGAIRDQIISWHVLGAMMLQFLGLPGTAQALAQQGPAAAQAWTAWASSNDMIRRGLEIATTAGGGAGVAVAYLPVAMAAAAEIREKRLGHQGFEAPPEPTADGVYPGMAEASPDDFAYVAPTGTDGRPGPY